MELVLTDDVRNSVGALQGGVVVAAIDAAEAVATVRMAEGVATRDLQLHFPSVATVRLAKPHPGSAAP